MESDTRPAICLGYLRLDRAGDLAPAEATCDQCGGDLSGPAWLAAMLGPDGVYLTGPYCDLCATTEG